MLKKILDRFKTDPLSEPLVLQNQIGRELIYDLKAIGNGQYVLPSDKVLVSILASNAGQKGLFKAAFGDGKLERFLSQKLIEENCSQAVVISLKFISKQKKRWNPEQAFEVSYDNQVSPTRIPTVSLKIQSGKAERKLYNFTQEVINLGRGSEVVDKYGTLIRKNDVAFAETADGPNTHVSKIHAQIKYRPAENTFYLTDSASEFGLVTNGTRLFRQGNLIANLNADQKVPLQNGDEIHLGKARVTFVVPAKT